MTNSTSAEETGSPVQWLRTTMRAMWRDAKSVYYANTMIWRVFKSGALIFLGLFCWVGANLMLSYRQDWGFLYYLMAYGFVLLLWGPLTHFVVVPLVIRFRRSGEGGFKRWFARHGTKANLTVFFLLVLALGTAPLGIMTFDFQLGGSGDTSDINPQLQCTKSPDTVHCHLSDATGIDSVAITSSGEEIERVEDPPYDFDLAIDEITTRQGDKRFIVELRDENGDTIRRYSRRVPLIPGS